MLRRLHSLRWLLALTALSVAYAGPVAACVCAKGAPPDMSCCPDQYGSSPSSCDQRDANADAVCTPVSAHALPNVAFDLFAPLANFAPAAPLCSVHGPPPVPIPARQPPIDHPPIYLATLRLRN